MDECKVEEENLSVTNGVQNPALEADRPPPISKEEQEATHRKVDEESIESSSLGKTKSGCKFTTIIFITFGVVIGVVLLATVIYFTVVLTDKENDKSKANKAAIGLLGRKETTSSTEFSASTEESLNEDDSNGQIHSQPVTPETATTSKTDTVARSNVKLKSLRGLPRPPAAITTTEKPTTTTTTAPFYPISKTDLRSLRGRPRPPAPTTMAETPSTTATPVPSLNVALKSLRGRPRPPELTTTTETPTTTTEFPASSTATGLVPRLNIALKSLRGRPRPPAATKTTVPTTDDVTAEGIHNSVRERPVLTIAAVKPINDKVWKTLFTAATTDSPLACSDALNITTSSIKNGEGGKNGGDDDTTGGEEDTTGAEGDTICGEGDTGGESDTTGGKSSAAHVETSNIDITDESGNTANTDI